MATVSFPKRNSQTQLNNIFAELSEQHPSKISYIIWNNPKDPNSLRLSISGYHFVTQKLNFKSYKFDLDRPLTNRNLLQLERHFPGMYFILRDTFIVFDEEEASMINLMSGNIVAYLNNLEINNMVDK